MIRNYLQNITKIKLLLITFLSSLGWAINRTRKVAPEKARMGLISIPQRRKNSQISKHARRRGRSVVRRLPK